MSLVETSWPVHAPGLDGLDRLGLRCVDTVRPELAVVPSLLEGALKSGYIITCRDASLILIIKEIYYGKKQSYNK